MGPKKLAPAKAAARYFKGKAPVEQPPSSDSEDSEQGETIKNVVTDKQTLVGNDLQDSEDEEDLRRRKLRERLLARSAQENETEAPKIQVQKPQQEEIISSVIKIQAEEKSSSEYTTSSEEETSEDDTYPSRPILQKPVFVSKTNRATVTESERKQKEMERAEISRMKHLDERKIETSELVMEILRKEMIERNSSVFLTLYS